MEQKHIVLVSDKAKVKPSLGVNCLVCTLVLDFRSTHQFLFLVIQGVSAWKKLRVVAMGDRYVGVDDTSTYNKKLRRVYYVNLNTMVWQYFTSEISPMKFPTHRTEWQDKPCNTEGG